MNMGQSWSIPLFKVFGIRLELHLTFFSPPLLCGLDRHGCGWGGGCALEPAACFAALRVRGFARAGGNCLAARGVRHCHAPHSFSCPSWGMAQLTEMPRQPWRGVCHHGGRSGG